MSQVIAFQDTLRPALPEVFGCQDYRDEVLLLERMNRILFLGGIEERFIRMSVELYDQRRLSKGMSVRAAARARHAQHSRKALRCMILKAFLGLSLREMSKQLAHSSLYRSFCRLEDFDRVQVPGKSTLDAYAKWLPANQMGEVLDTLTHAVSNEEAARQIGLKNELDAAVAWVDSTCLKANVHYPIDWILLRDGVVSLVGTIRTIRKHGLYCRMPAPESFVRTMNGLAMAMSAAGRRGGSKKARKAILRKMKRLSQTVESHGRRYRKRLDQDWQKTDLSRKETEVFLRRLDNILGQLPEARRQAHERIIGGRPIANSEKILSLFEKDIHVIVRGKAGAEIEYGNSLFIAESSAGLILDHELRREASPGDARWLQERFGKLRSKSNQTLHGVVADRGFDSRACRKMLEEAECYNGVCPRDPVVLSRQMEEDEVFVQVQRRRAQTEGRIGILKNAFLDGCPKAKGFAHRQLQVAWAILAHNLWVIARQPWTQEKEKAPPALAA